MFLLNRSLTSLVRRKRAGIEVDYTSPEGDCYCTGFEGRMGKSRTLRVICYTSQRKSDVINDCTYKGKIREGPFDIHGGRLGFF